MFRFEMILTVDQQESTVQRALYNHTDNRQFDKNIIQFYKDIDVMTVYYYFIKYYQVFPLSYINIVWNNIQNKEIGS